MNWTRICLLCLVSASLAPAEWSRFRGPNGSGLDDSHPLPVEFGPSKNLAWKAAVPFGQSSPIVAAGRVFLTAADAGKLVTLAFDEKSGRPLWRRELTPAKFQQIYKANDPASPTPAADAKNVYVFFPDFGLIAYDFDGTERWRVPLGPFRNHYGMASSPIVAGSSILLVCDQQSGSFLIAIDKETGKTRWKVDRQGAQEGWGVPALYTPPSGPPELIVFGGTRVDSYFAATGERHWWVPITSNGSMGTPVILGSTVFLSASGFDQPWLPTFESQLAVLDKDKDGLISSTEILANSEYAEHFGWVDANGDKKVNAAEWNAARNFGVGDFGILSIAMGGKGQLPASAIRWKAKKNVPYIPALLIYRDVLYAVQSGVISSVDLKSGAYLKQGRSPNALGNYNASPVAGDGKVYLVSEEGKVSVLRAAAQWEPLAVNDLKEECFATPAISNGRLLIRTRGTLFSFGAP